MTAFPMVVATRAAGHRTRRLAMRELAAVGLFPGQEVLLTALAEHGTLNQSQLAQILQIEPPSVTGMVVKLEGAGLVTRVAAGRQKQLTLTPAGVEAAQRVHQAYEQMERSLTAGLSPAEVDAVVAALQLVSTAADRALASDG